MTSSPTPATTLSPSTGAPTYQPTRYPTRNMTLATPGAEAALWSMSMVSVALSVIATYRLLKWFAREDTPTYALFIVGLSWFLGFAGVLVLLPLDLVSAFFNAVYMEIDMAWKVVYVLTWLLAWVICAVAGEYHLDGYFTFRARMCSAIWTTIRIYLILLVVVAVVGIIVFFTVGITLQYVVAASNFYGMLLIIIMLGYGLVETPSSLWRNADASGTLDSEYFRAGVVQTAMIDAEDRVNEAVDDVVAFRNRLSRSAERDPVLETRADEVLALAPRRDVNVRGVQAPPARPPPAGAGGGGGGGAGSNGSTGVGRGAEVPLTMASLAMLHQRLKVAITAHQRAQWEWNYLLNRTAQLDKVIAFNSDRVIPEDAAETGGGVAMSRASGPAQGAGGAAAGNGAAPYDTADGSGNGSAGEGGDGRIVAAHGPLRALSHALDRLQMRYHALFYRTLAFFCACASLVLLWCAVVAPIDINLSVYGLALNAANDAITVWLCSFWPLVYMAVCCYMALFKFNYFDVLALHGNHQTDAYNLLYNASYLSRLQFALGVTYFGFLKAEDAAGTAFHQLVGDMDTTQFTGVSFNRYSPVLILFFSAASFFNAGDRCLDFLGIGTHKRPRRGVREHDERIEEGRRIVAAARASIERERQRRFQRAVAAYGVRSQLGATANREGTYARVEDLMQRM